LDANDVWQRFRLAEGQFGIAEQHLAALLEASASHNEAALKYEFDGAGFGYEGLFDYVSHSGTHPTSFVLRRASLPVNVRKHVGT
jgi:hypothetical protein